MRCLVRAAPGKARCRFHGGLSTGPRTEAGRARIADAQRRRGRAYREKLQAILDQAVCRQSPSRIGSSSPRARENFSAISSSLRTSGTGTSRASPGRHGTGRRCGRFRLKAASRRCTRPARLPSSEGKKNPIAAAALVQRPRRRRSSSSRHRRHSEAEARNAWPHRTGGRGDDGHNSEKSVGSGEAERPEKVLPDWIRARQPCTGRKSPRSRSPKAACFLAIVRHPKEVMRANLAAGSTRPILDGGCHPI